MRLHHGFVAAWLLALTAASAAPGQVPDAGQAPYSEADFARVPKFDAHVHDNVARTAFIDIARKDGFELLSINVDYPDFPPLALQAKAAEEQAKPRPQKTGSDIVISVDMHAARRGGRRMQA